MFFRQKQKPSHERAMDWFRQHMVAGKGIIVHTKEPVPYPKVTGRTSGFALDEIYLGRYSVPPIRP